MHAHVRHILAITTEHSRMPPLARNITDCDAPFEQGRQLVTKRLPPSRPHDTEDVPAGDSRVDDLLQSQQQQQSEA